jgi:hypothetical protein
MIASEGGAMRFLENALLFFLAGFSGYLVNADWGNIVGIFLSIALPVAGVYLLGWWALFTYFAGIAFGGMIFWRSEASRGSGSDE